MRFPGELILQPPSKEVLDNLNPIPFDQLEESWSMNSSLQKIKIYIWKDRVFDGWALQVFPDSDHRFRYLKFELGEIVWQIGYYDNAELDHDFHLEQGNNYGSQRMWRKGGAPYINNYFLRGGVQNGMQFRWYAHHQLAEKSYYENGVLIYKLKLDTNGQVLEQFGVIPDH